MHTDLMGPSCIQLEADMRIIGKPFKHPDFGFRKLSVFTDFPFNDAAVFPSDWSSDCKLILVYDSMNQRLIPPFHLLLLLLHGDHMMDVAVFCNTDEAGRIAVQPCGNVQ